MKRVFALLSFVLMAHATFAYTAVLKSGKKIEGTLVLQDETSVQVKGNDGITLRLNRSSIDEGATAAANTSIQVETRPAADPQGESKSGLSETPTTLQKQSNEKTRVLTNEDLKDMPEVSVLGSSESSDLESGSRPGKERLEGKEPNETFWRTAATRLRQKKAVAEERCRFVRNKPAVATEKAPECPLMQEVEKQIDEFRERAREKGVPTNWYADLDE